MCRCALAGAWAPPDCSRYTDAPNAGIVRPVHSLGEAAYAAKPASCHRCHFCRHPGLRHDGHSCPHAWRQLSGNADFRASQFFRRHSGAVTALAQQTVFGLAADQPAAFPSDQPCAFICSGDGAVMLLHGADENRIRHRRRAWLQRTNVHHRAVGATSRASDRDLAVECGVPWIRRRGYHHAALSGRFFALHGVAGDRRLLLRNLQCPCQVLPAGDSLGGDSGWPADRDLRAGDDCGDPVCRSRSHHHSWRCRPVRDHGGAWRHRSSEPCHCLQAGRSQQRIAI